MDAEELIRWSTTDSSERKHERTTSSPRGALNPQSTSPFSPPSAKTSTKRAFTPAADSIASTDASTSASNCVQPICMKTSTTMCPCPTGIFMPLSWNHPLITSDKDSGNHTRALPRAKSSERHASISVNESEMTHQTLTSDKPRGLFTSDRSVEQQSPSIYRMRGHDLAIGGIEVPFIQSAYENTRTEETNHSWMGSNQASGSRPAPQPGAQGNLQFSSSRGNNGEDTMLEADAGEPSSSGQDANRKYPCVWHEFGQGIDPTPTCWIRKMHISQLQPHFACQQHRFFPCDNCFDAFDSVAALRAHKHQARQAGTRVCTFRCVEERCPNFRQQPQQGGRPCNHGMRNSRRAVWRETYRVARRAEPPAYAPFPEIRHNGSPSLASLSPSTLLGSNPSTHGVFGDMLRRDDSFYTADSVEGRDLDVPHGSQPADLTTDRLSHLRTLAIDEFHLVVQSEPPWWPEELWARHREALAAVRARPSTIDPYIADLSIRLRNMESLLARFESVLNYAWTRTPQEWTLIASMMLQAFFVDGQPLPFMIPDRMPWATGQADHEHDALLQAVSSPPFDGDVMLADAEFPSVPPDNVLPSGVGPEIHVSDLEPDIAMEYERQSDQEATQQALPGSLALPDSDIATPSAGASLRATDWWYYRRQRDS